MRWYLHVRYRPARPPLPCPGCGQSDRMWAGVSAATEAGVGCSRCRLYVLRDLDGPPRASAPEGVRKRGWSETRDWAYAHYTRRAIRAWDRLPRLNLDPPADTIPGSAPPARKRRR